MNIFLPFTHLRAETMAAALKADPQCITYCPLIDHEHGYWHYWCDRWRAGEQFINIEQDVMPMAGVLKEMWECPESYCRTDYAYPWSGSRIDVSPIGCAKFSSGFINEHRAVFNPGRIHWHEPQHIILNASLNKAHVHAPPSLHLHVGPDWPLDARRRYETP